MNNYVPCIPYCSEEIVIISREIATLLEKGVIVETRREPQDFISTVVTRKKKDGSMHIILNLKQLSKYVKYRCFKYYSSNAR